MTVGTTIEDYERFSILFNDAIKEGLSLAKEAIDTGTYLFRHFEYPTIIYNSSNGMPTFGKARRDNPIDYGCIFRSNSLLFLLSKTKPIFPEERFPNTEKLINYCRQSTLIKSAILGSYDESIFKGTVEYRLREIIGDCVDRYIHVFQTLEPTKENISAITLPIFKALTYGTLDVSIVIPIAIVPFKFNRIKIAPKTYIMKMDDSFQLSRSMIRNYGSGAHEHVVGAATHAFVLTKWSLNGTQGYFNSLRSLSSIDTFPHKEIDTLFAALRMETGYQTGYGQLLYWPRGWAWSYYAGLPPLHGTTVRQYPNALDNYGWNRELEPVSKEIAKAVGALYQTLSKSSHSQLDIAIKRLNSCHLRDNHEDTVIDACIGLETLLSDGDPNEMTHKLALRCAALSKLYQMSQAEVFRDIKSIYGVRSAIVHGGKRKRNMKLSVEGASIKAVKYLVMIIKVLLEHQEYLEPSKIDSDILLGNA